MKKLLVAVEDEKELIGEIKNNIEEIAEKHNAEIIGVMVYPHGLIESEPDIFMDGTKDIDVDIVVVTSPAFVINELTSKEKVSKMAEERGLILIDATLKIELKEVTQELSDTMIEKIKGMVETAKYIKGELMMESQKRENIMIMSNEDTQEFDMYIGTIGQTGAKRINRVVIEGKEYDRVVNEKIKSIIDKNNIGKIYVYSDFNSNIFDESMQEYKNEGIEVIYNDQSLEMHNKHTSVVMN